MEDRFHITNIEKYELPKVEVQTIISGNIVCASRNGGTEDFKLENFEW